MDINDIAGHSKGGTTLLRPLQDRYVTKLIDVVPSFIETNHLTLLSIAFSFFVVLGAYLSRYDILWVLLVIAANIGQYLSDFLDGSIGRKRNTGLIFWGFFVDHYLDFFFASSNIIAFSLVLSLSQYFAMWMLILVAANFLIELHKCNMFGKYNVNGSNLIGGIELRFITVILFTLTMVIYDHMNLVMAIVVIIETIQIVVEFYKFQKELWELDMENKRRQIRK